MNQFTYLTVLIALLALTVVFLSYRWFQARKKLADYLSVLKRIESGTENAKIFVHGKGMIADIGFQTNRIIDVYREQIIELKKSQLSNKQLLTSLSHDVRTPLTSLLGYLDAVTNQVATGIEKEEYIRIARNKAYNLKDFVDTLFEWSKLDSRERIFHFETVDINEFTRSLIIDWLPMLDQKNIRYRIEIADDELYCQLDKEGYTRIINNLIQNAVFHSGGDSIDIEIKSQECNTRINISDNGQGIPESKLPFVFERLYKCDDARTGQGSGLGLAITKELVEAHHGTIVATSIPHKKTTFTITLPIKSSV